MSKNAVNRCRLFWSTIYSSTILLKESVVVAVAVVVMLLLQWFVLLLPIVKNENLIKKELFLRVDT